MKNLRNCLMATCALTLAAVPMVARADDAPAPAAAADSAAPNGQLAEIVVTAQKRSEKLTNVPITITSVSVAHLQDANINSVFALNQVVPGLRIDNASGYIQPSIRGVGNSIAGTGYSNNVATYVDGFYISSQNSANARFLNVESVDVLKGPQGTLFGRNATGGAIQIRLREPTQTPTLELSQTYARFGEAETQFYGSVGLTSTLAASVGVYYERGDGFTHNLGANADYNDRYQNWNARGTLLWRPADGIKFKLAYEHASEDDGRPSADNIWIDPATGQPQSAAALGNAFGDPALAANKLATARNQVSLSAPVSVIGKGDSVFLTSTFNLGGATLTSYTMYQHQTTINNIDLDGSNLSLLEGHFDLQNKTFTQEFNLTGKTGRLDYVLGANYYHHSEHQGPFPLLQGGALLNGIFGLPLPNGVLLDPLYTANARVSAFAVFADGTYNLADHLYITVGARFSYEKETSSWDCPALSAGFGVCPVGPSGDFSHHWNSFTPRAVVRYEPAANMSVYASYSRGFKSGTLTPNGFTMTPLKQEDIDAYEVGYKYGGHTFRLATAAYYYNYRNLQMAYYVNGTGRYENVPLSRIYGAEISATALLFPGFEASIGANYNHANYINFTNAPKWGLNPGPLAGWQFASSPQDVSGTQMQRAPRLSGNVSFNYAADLAGGKLKLGSNLAFTSGFGFDPVNEFRQKGYALLSADVNWTEPSGHITFGLFGTNLTDTKYYSQFNPGGEAILVRWGEPAVYGGRVSIKY